MEDNAQLATHENSSDMSACLLKVIVHEHEYEADPNSAYKDSVVDWVFASRYIAEKVLQKGQKG